ncbi:MAG: ornithine cyclodeaminase, partial [Candidatus Rokubacteria bacterium]|nr:ornithine cyclodeaminase [Candidatus Rokubacteria bacterium]
MRVLSRADLERLLTPADLIAALDEAFRAYGEGRCRVPARTSVASADGVLLVMPAAADTGDAAALGAKLVSVFPGNRARGHPTLYATYLLLDAATGAPLALLDGTVLTALRTGATSALAARYLARPDSRRLVCFGAGVQAA